MVNFCKEVNKKMNVRDLITLGELAIKKFDGDVSLQEVINEMKENVRRLKLLSPEKLNKELTKAKADRAKRFYKKLGISFTEILPDVSLTSY